MEKVNDKQARLTIFGMPRTTKRDRKRIVKWLRDIADEVEKEGDPAIYTNNPRWTLYKLLKQNI